jgi:hypothetical protein
MGMLGGHLSPRWMGQQQQLATVLALVQGAGDHRAECTRASTMIYRRR